MVAGQMHVRSLAALMINKQQSLNGLGDAGKKQPKLVWTSLSYKYNHNIRSSSFKLGSEYNVFKV